MSEKEINDNVQIALKIKPGDEFMKWKLGTRFKKKYEKYNLFYVKSIYINENDNIHYFASQEFNHNTKYLNHTKSIMISYNDKELSEFKYSPSNWINVGDLIIISEITTTADGYTIHIGDRVFYDISGRFINGQAIQVLVVESNDSNELCVQNEKDPRKSLMIVPNTRLYYNYPGLQ